MHDVLEIGEASRTSATIFTTPRQTELPQATGKMQPGWTSPAATSLSGQRDSDTHVTNAAQLSLGGHRFCETQKPTAAQTSSDEGQKLPERHQESALVGNLSIECRRYEDLRRARQRLLLQAMSMCRYACDGDKVAGGKLYKQVQADQSHPIALWLLPYFEAMKPLDTAIKVQEKTVAKLARQLPVWRWAESVAGLSDRFLGMIVGECSAPVGEFKSVSAVWKRMGLAVIDGGRQRRVLGDAAIAHGYVARRRSLMWNIGESIIKQQVRKQEDGTRYSTGYYGAIYLERKAYEAERVDTAAQAHNRAKRYMEKRLLRELYRAWRTA